jgi:hypothetical protein
VKYQITPFAVRSWPTLLHHANENINATKKDASEVMDAALKTRIVCSSKPDNFIFLTNTRISNVLKRQNQTGVCPQTSKEGQTSPSMHHPCGHAQRKSVDKAHISTANRFKFVECAVLGQWEGEYKHKSTLGSAPKKEGAREETAN